MPVGKSTFAANPPAPSPVRTDTVLELKFVTARSARPSPVTSPIATEPGCGPVASSFLAPNPPIPFPGRIDTVFEL